MKDSPELFARRTLYAKTVSMLEGRTNEVQMHPRYGPSVREQLIRFRGDAGAFDNGQAQGFSISSLPLLCDNFRPMVEAYGEVGNYFPTMCCSVEVKKAPPTPQGWQWLFMRAKTRVIKKERNDIGVVIMDGEGMWRRFLYQRRGI
jgi:hypothetical protein